MHVLTGSYPTVPPPLTYLSWDKKSVKVTGNVSDIAVGDEMTIELTGKVMGTTEREDSCSIDLQLEAINLVGEAEDTTESEDPHSYGNHTMQDYSEHMADSMARQVAKVKERRVAGNKSRGIQYV